MDVIIPYVSINADYDFGGPEANGAGFGDILVGPYLQWDPIMGKKRAGLHASHRTTDDFPHREI